MRRARPILLLVAAALAGCAGAPAPPAGDAGALAPAAGGPAAAAVDLSPLAARFAGRAAAAERAGDLRGALEAWRVVAGVRPADEEARRRVADLGERLAKEAERRYREGLALIGRGAPDAARRELVLALAADPGHAGALEALRTRLDPDLERHTVAPGETLEGIARASYGDPAKAVFIARVNDLDAAAKLAPGTVLAVPALAPAAAAPAGKGGVRAEPAAAAAEYPEAGGDAGADTAPEGIAAEPPPAALPAAAPTPPPAAVPAPPPAEKPRDPAEDRLALAEDLLKARRFADAAAAAEPLAGHPRLGKRAREIGADSWFGIGDQALREDRFADAAAAYRKADPAAKDVAAALAGVERRKLERAEERYNEGVRLFINQSLDEAIASWEQTLALNPRHPKAAKDVEKARALQQKLREIK